MTEKEPTLAMNAQKTYRAFRWAARGLLARIGIDCGKRNRHGVGFTALENHQIDRIKSDDEYISYEERHITFISFKMAAFFRMARKLDNALVAAYKIDPIKYDLDRDKFLNQFQRPPLSAKEKDILEAIMDSDLPLEAKLQKMRGQQAKRFYKYFYDEILSEEAKERIVSECENKPEKKLARILEFPFVEGKKASLG